MAWEVQLNVVERSSDPDTQWDESWVQIVFRVERVNVGLGGGDKFSLRDKGFLGLVVCPWCKNRVFVFGLTIQGFIELVDAV